MLIKDFMVEGDTSPVKTLKGTVIKRARKYGVGKDIGGTVYVHASYEDALPDISQFKESLTRAFPDFEYNIIKYSPTATTFLYSPDFDAVHEPMITEYVTVKSDGSTKKGTTKAIYHHKWLFVKDDYTGFDVDMEIQRSREWLKIPDIDFRRIGSSKEFWLNFLQDNKEQLPDDFDIS